MYVADDEIHMETILQIEESGNHDTKSHMLGIWMRVKLKNIQPGNNDMYFARKYIAYTI